MIDVGLAAGVKELWQDGMLHDLTLKVEDHEFPVHKVVVASVSKYLKAMLGGGFKESKMDQVELIGLSSNAVSKLLQFIYTGEENSINDDTIEILRCAVYLQMPLVAGFCVKKLLQDLNHKNCMTVLSVFKEFSFHEDVEKTKNFIKLNWRMVVEHCNPEDISADAVQVLIDYWGTSDWEMFLFIKDWVHGEFETRKASVTDLMSQVRFSAIDPKEIEAITEMDIFCHTEGSWKDLVERALQYHQLPINLKVLDKSEQTQLRTESGPVIFLLDTDSFFTLDKRNHWMKHECKTLNTPDCYALYNIINSIEVNNFLIVWSQEWHIFDPRTLAWSKIANMPRPMVGFALVHHKEHLYTVGGYLYTVGGCHFPQIPAVEMHRYSFLTNTWEASKELPIPIDSPAACVLEDKIYVSGGWIKENGNDAANQSDRFYCLDLSSPSPEWERKVSCLWTCGRHDMCVVKLNGEEVVLNIYELHLQYYSPSRNQWFGINEDYMLPEYSPWGYHISLGTKDNSLFMLNAVHSEDDEVVEWKHACWHWKLLENPAQIIEVAIDDIPLPLGSFKIRQRMCIAALAMPPETYRRNKFSEHGKSPPE